MSIKQSPALDYHAMPKPGKLEVHVTKDTSTQDDLALAYSPGVAEPVLEIAKDPNNSYKYTSKGNLVGVITNGTAILGLGNLGALASKPVMEGKAALFKKFADIDVFDIEIDCQDPNEFIKTVANIAPTFGGINLEDIKAPDCFVIENELKKLIDIPVFHDDQHGTAVSIAAGLINALELQGKTLASSKIACIGAGAAALASMEFLVQLGAKRNNIFLVDSKGLVTNSRDGVNEYKRAFAQNIPETSQQAAIKDADILIGLAGPDIITPTELKSMKDNPIIFILSNPDPEINYDLAKATRPDGIVATGRSDLPNQINNVLCFPYIFRGALNMKAKAITFEMQKAAAYAIASIAKSKIPEEIVKSYKLPQDFKFGPEYIIPMPLDPRLISKVTAAVEAAV
ncbi:MAG: malic enzyme-like NAD(P)-binding protein [Pseudomonadota bacterium]|nr:malic enzyme-like NAD(P)-binding protein [Pseudomonadota bacterium]